MAKKNSARTFGTASVWICPDHADLANRLRDEGKQGKNVFAGAGLGVFKTQLDSYVLAASIGLALRESTPSENMPEGPKETPAWKQIREDTVMNNAGAKQLALLAGLLTHKNNPEIDEDKDDSERLENQINQLTLQVEDDKETWVDRLELLDRYAHRGFEWLLHKEENHQSSEDIIFMGITQLNPEEYDAEDSTGTHDLLQRKLNAAS